MGAISIRGMTHQNGRSKWISFPWPEAREALAARMLAWLPQVNNLQLNHIVHPPHVTLWKKV